MLSLDNSRRVTYKATHVTTVPPISANAAAAPAAGAPVGAATAAGRKARPPRASTRAVPKAAFVASLRIQPQEMANLEQDYAARRKGKGPDDPDLLPAARAMGKLSKDGSATSVVRNAPLFAKIPSAAILAVAHDLQRARQRAHDAAAAAIFAIHADFLSGRSPAPAKTLAWQPTRGQSKASTIPSADNFPQEAQPALVRLFRTKPTAKGDASSAPVSAAKAGNAISWAVAVDHPELKKFTSAAKLIGTPLISLAQVINWKVILGNLKFIGFNTAATINAFQETLPLEPVGRLHLERVEMVPIGIERGELLHSVPMTPNETVNISHKEWSATSSEFDSIVSDELSGYAEKGVSEKSDVSQASDTEAKHATALNVGVSLSASYASVTLSSNFGYNNTSESSTSVKDSAVHSSNITSKAASRTRQEHKISFKVSSASGTEDLAIRTLTNTSTNPVRYDYFQLVRKWRVDLIRYGLRMTYDIVIPSPGSLLISKVDELRQVQEKLNASFVFGLTPDAITRGSWASKAAQWQANVQPPPPDTLTLDVPKPFQSPDESKTQYDSVTLDVDPQYVVESAAFGAWYQPSHNNQDPSDQTNGNNSIFDVMGEPPGPSIGWGGYGSTLDAIVGRTGSISLVFSFLRIVSGSAQVVATLKLTPDAFAAWQMAAWGTMYQAAQNEDQLNRSRLSDHAKSLQAEIDAFTPLDLRQLEREEIMKGVLRWLMGPTFELVPSEIVSLFGSAKPSDPYNVALDPGSVAIAQGGWGSVVGYGEFIKYIHNAIEWENVLYINYPYFWDAPSNWSNKLFLNHWDPEHRMFLRSGAARVVLTIRPGFEDSFTFLMEGGAFKDLPTSPYVTIAQEIQDYALTNFPGIAPANPDVNVRPLLYLEQKRTWKTMQFLIQLLRFYRADPANLGSYPSTAAGLAALQPYVAAASQTNSTVNATLAIADAEQQKPSYSNVPFNDDWGNPFFYQCPGVTGDYDLISYGADGQPGGADKSADISANADGSLVSQWFEYTPTSAMDVSMTTNLATTQPADMA